jgi:hypothetical protein
MSKPTDPKSTTKSPSTPPTPAAPAPSLPKSWADIKVGSLVIAQESVADGWWEAVVTSMTDTTLTMKWRDYPRLPIITRRRNDVALLDPGK